MRKLISHLRQAGTRRPSATVLAENGPMLGLARSLGFVLEPPRDGVRQISLPLQATNVKAGTQD